jgi:hypothetical protein
MEFALRHSSAGCFDLLFRKIDTDDIAIRQKPKQMTAAASDLEDACVRGNQIAVIAGQQFPVKTPHPL